MTLQTTAEIKAFLKKHGLNPKKGLGQHFLCDPQIIQAIVCAAGPAKGILEIGPGPGILTHAFPPESSVIAVEIDSSLKLSLNESAPNAEIIFADALTFDWKAGLSPLPRPRWIVSNMPYYLSGALLQKTAEVAMEIDGAILMMQAEVADRITAPPGDRHRGSLTVYLEAAFSISRVIDVPAHSFFPPPSVESRVLRFAPHQLLKESPQFFEFVRQGFKQPRKTLVNNLTQLAGANKPDIEAKIESLGWEPSIRPHFLSLQNWRDLYQLLCTP